MIKQMATIYSPVLRFVVKFLPAAMLSCICSCTSEPYFSIPECQLSYEFEAAGGTKFASIGSNVDFSASSDSDWCYVETYDHPNNNLRITVYENDMAADRSAVIEVKAGNLQPKTVSVYQKAAPAYIRILTKDVLLDMETLDFSVSVKANTLYDMTLPEWIHSKEGNAPSTGEVTLYFSSDEIPGGMSERTGKILLTSKEDPSLTASVTVTQTQEVLPILDETFDFAVGTAKQPGSTSGEKTWASLGATTNGWTVETVNNQMNVWAREGCLRFSRTGYGGKLVSPKLSAIKGTADVIVTFKAARWKGSDTYHKFMIVIRNAGEASQSIFEINNVDADVWQENPEAVYSFYITGATQETQIMFISADNENGYLGDDKKGVGRLLLDDVKVEYK